MSRLLVGIEFYKRIQYMNRISKPWRVALTLSKLELCENCSVVGGKLRKAPFGP